MLEDKLKAPEGKFAVCVWDPSNPEKSTPYIVDIEPDKEAIFDSEDAAIEYAEERNRKAPKLKFAETDYFVMNDKGFRVY